MPKVVVLFESSRMKSNYLLLFFIIRPVICKLRENVILQVGPGQRDCYFFSNVSEGDWVNIDYQVISASGVAGNFDLEVEIMDPHGDPIFDQGQGDFNEFETRAKLEGDYEICLHNSMLAVSTKSVYLGIAVTDPEDSYYDWDMHNDGDSINYSEFDEIIAGFDPQSTFPLFRDKLLTIHKRLRESQRLQDMMEASYSQDMKMAEANNEKIVFWSMMHLFLVLVVGCLQVGLLKSLFMDKKLVCRMIRPNYSGQQKLSALAADTVF